MATWASWVVEMGHNDRLALLRVTAWPIRAVGFPDLGSVGGRDWACGESPGSATDPMIEPVAQDALTVSLG